MPVFQTTFKALSTGNTTQTTKIVPSGLLAASPLLFTFGCYHCSKTKYRMNMQQTELTIDDAIKIAVAHHKNNNLEDAKKLYIAILRANPSHPDANHNLGVIAFGSGDFETAYRLVSNAIKSDPSNAVYPQTLELISQKLHRGG